MRLFKHPLSLRKTGETLFPTTEVSQGRVIPLLAGARVFPEAQPREWAAPANSSSEGLGNNSGVNGGRACRRCWPGGDHTVSLNFSWFSGPQQKYADRILPRDRRVPGLVAAVRVPSLEDIEVHPMPCANDR